MGRIDYEDALARQTDVFNRLIQAKVENREEESVLFFAEHNPVLTLGKSGKETNLLVSEERLKALGVSFYHVTRGGDITYHGPGQITGYPVFDLDKWNLGLKDYIYKMEDVIIRFLALYNIKGEKMNEATGVWLDPNDPKRARKICAIGVRSSHYVTMHGLALNVNTDLRYFSYIHPCGFIDKGVTSLRQELKHDVPMDEVKQRLEGELRILFQCQAAKYGA